MHRNNLYAFIVALVLSLTAISCTNQYTPKPHGYPRIDFPEKSYRSFSNDCPFEFEIPTYAVMARDTDANTEPCWYNLDFSYFDVTIHMSYKELAKPEDINRLTQDAYRLAMKHSIKAEEIAETEIADSANGNFGMLYDFFGKTATPFNFYISDNQRHFLRGAFYFNQHTQSDSVAPVVKFLKKDLVHLISTLRWKN